MTKAVDKARKISFANTAEVCNCFGIERDAYYKFQRCLRIKHDIESQVLELVKERRKVLAREGTRKLHVVLSNKFQDRDLKVGRDRLFGILREADLLIKRKRAFTRTTNSYHHFHKYNNLIKNIKPIRPNQIWVSDITYIRTRKGFCYLALITDLYSRKIVGYE